MKNRWHSSKRAKYNLGYHLIWCIKYRRKALMNLFRAHKKISNQRKDFHFKLAKNLSEKYDLLIFENLNIKALQKCYGRKILDLSFSNFLKILKSYEDKNGSKIIYIDRFYPSSKICYHCKKINENLNLKDRIWICPHCKRKILRDKNAAKNIKRQGIVLWYRERKTLKIRAIPA
jgi:putative transposase